MNQKQFLILYGSQTGNAQEYAERIWREGKVINLSGPVKCMDDYPVQNLIFEPVVIFVCSTTGQGEEPDNMKQFWRFLLRKNLPHNSLQNMKFAVLGLGDSSYVKFNFVAKRLARRLSDLGGTPLIETGLADEQHDLGSDAVVDPWIDKLWAAVGSFYNESFNRKTVNFVPLPRWHVEKIGSNIVDNSNNDSKNYYIKRKKDYKLYTQTNPAVLHIMTNKRITDPNHYQDVRLLEFRTPNNLTYKPGDVLMLVPQNKSEKVDELFLILNSGREESQKLLPTDMINVSPKDNDMPVPEALREPLSLWDCAKKYWDLNAVPRRYTFTVLGHVTSSELEKEKLLEFAKAEGQEELYNYCNRPRRNILEVLQDFPEAARNVTLEFLFEIFVPIRPRAFSIASSPSFHPDEIHILMAVVQYKTRLLKPRFGLCSRFLSDSNVGDKVYGWVRQGSFRFPDPDRPVIMIGPGTGVAPFRSYINELVALGKADKKNLVLFFGCRKRNSDFHCRLEWEKLISENKLTMFIAFSQDQPDKVYVQHLMVREGELIWDLLYNRNASIFLAGSAKNMPQAVREAFFKIAQTHGGLNEKEAEQFILQLEKTGKYQSETWS